MITSLSEVYLLSFPREFHRLMQFFETIFNLNIISLGVPLECLGLESFYLKLQSVALAPAGLIFVILLTTLNVGAIRAVKAETEAVKRFKAIWSLVLQRGVPPCMIICFLTLPLVSSLAFRAFSCECFDNHDQCYLRADYSQVPAPPHPHPPTHTQLLTKHAPRALPTCTSPRACVSAPPSPSVSSRPPRPP